MSVKKIGGGIPANYFCSIPSPPPGSGLFWGCSPGYSFTFSLSPVRYTPFLALYIYHISSSSSIFSLHLAFTRLFPHFFLPKPTPSFSRNPPSISSLSVFFQSESLFILSHCQYTSLSVLVFHTIFYSTVNILPVFYLSIFTFWAILFLLVFSLDLCLSTGSCSLSIVGFRTSRRAAGSVTLI